MPQSHPSKIAEPEPKSSHLRDGSISPGDVNEGDIQAFIHGLTAGQVIQLVLLECRKALGST